MIVCAIADNGANFSTLHAPAATVILERFRVQEPVAGSHSDRQRALLASITWLSRPCIAPRVELQYVPLLLVSEGIMKQPVTFRLDPDLLAAARFCAERENRTLTNFVETVVKQHVVRAHGYSERSLAPQRRTLARLLDGEAVRVAPTPKANGID